MTQNKLLGESGQILVEFTLSILVVAVLFLGVATLLLKEFKKAQCFHIVFQSERKKIYSKTGLPSFHLADLGCDRFQLKKLSELEENK